MDKVIETKLEIFDWFNTIKSIDLWITDPPYPFNNKNGSGRFHFSDSVDSMYERMTWKYLGSCFQEMYNKTAVGGRAYVFCNKDGLFKTRELLIDAGYEFRNILVWDKCAMGMGYHWRNQVEYICYVTKGKPKIYIKGQPNIFKYKKPKKSFFIEEIEYNADGLSAKPQEIYRDILEFGAIQGDIVADPFAGTNPMKAALYLNKDLLSKIAKAYVNCF